MDVDVDEDLLGEMEFLARSSNRLAVLRATADGPRTRGEVAVAIDASQPTLGRVLDDLTERGWLAREADGYRLTASGRMVLRAVDDLLETLSVERRLRDVVAYLPTAEFDFGLERFAGATVTTPTPTRPDAPVRRMTELLARADHVRVVSYALNEAKLDLMADRVGEDLTVEGVFSREALDAVAADPTLGEQLRDLLGHDAAAVRIYDDEIPVALEITDDRVHLLCRDEAGLVRAAVDTDDPVVREWAIETHERYWERADPFEPPAVGR
ncbi:MAG: helix-turn-helix transcriptional regulator [Haloglomus sp.]